MSIPRSSAELRAQILKQHGADILSLVTYQSVMTLTTAGARIGAKLPKYHERIQRYLKHAQSEDIRVTECITDAKGNRSLPPAKQDDPDAYTRVVERRGDDIVIRGAKLHITAASLGHDLGQKDVLWVDYKSGVALHRVITTNPAEHRLQRLAAASPLQHRISYGCINVPAAFYDAVVDPAFARTSGIVYILPETRPIEQVFALAKP